MPHKKRQKPVPNQDPSRLGKTPAGVVGPPVPLVPDPVVAAERARQKLQDPFAPTQSSPASGTVSPKFSSKIPFIDRVAPDFIPPLPPGDPTRAGDIALPPDRPPFHSEDRLRRDRANFAIRQRADARRRQRLGLPPRQLGELPSLRTFARIRDASQISDAQIPGGVPTLNAPISRINPDNLRDGDVYRTVEGGFVRFNAEDRSFTPMLFAERGGVDQEGAFEIDPDVDDPAAEDVQELVTTRLLGLTNDKALASLDPVVATNIRQLGRAVQAFLDSDLKPQQVLAETSKLFSSMQKLFPEASPEEGPLPIHEAIDQLMEVDESGGRTIWNPKTQSLSYVPAKTAKDTAPLTTSSTVNAFVATGSNYKDFYKPFFDVEVEQIEDALAKFVEGGLQAHDDVERRGLFGFGGFHQEDINAAQDAYIAANLPLLDEALQPEARRLLEEMLQPGVIPTDTDKLINSEGDEIPRVNYIFNQIAIADLPPELTELANDRALITSKDQFEKVIRPGFQPGPPEAAPSPPGFTPIPDKKVNVGGSEMPVVEREGIMYPAPATPAAANGLPPGTIYMLPDGTLKKIPKEVADGK